MRTLGGADSTKRSYEGYTFKIIDEKIKNKSFRLQRRRRTFFFLKNWYLI